MKSSSLVSHLYRWKQQVQEEKRINMVEVFRKQFSRVVYVLCHIVA
jgi:hypothetical protein